MPLSIDTTETIYGRLKADFDQKMQNTNWFTRAFCLITLAVAAGGFRSVYHYIQKVGKQLFPDLAEEIWFAWHARFYGIDQVLATPAKFFYTFSGTVGPIFTIDEGTEVETDAGIIFATDEDVLFSGGTATVGITAKVSGTDGNVTATTMTLVNPIANVDDIGTVGEQTQIATDAQTLDEWKAALRQRNQNPPSSGNKEDYKRWSLEAGAGKVWVKTAPDWIGSGSVGIIISTASLEAVDSATKQAIIDNIEAKRPVSASYDVVDPVLKDITFEIDIIPNSAYFQEQIEDALEQVFLLQSEPGEIFLLSQINKAISNTGIDDFEITDILEDGISIGVGNIEQTGVALSRYDGSTFSLLTY